MLNGEFIECMAHDLEYSISMNSPPQKLQFFHMLYL